jgi:hypothetical protein
LICSGERWTNWFALIVLRHSIILAIKASAT